jgi:hypothetical protein
VTADSGNVRNAGVIFQLNYTEMSDKNYERIHALILLIIACFILGFQMAMGIWCLVCATNILKAADNKNNE